MQIQTTMRCHLIFVRMAIVKESRNKKCWRGYGERESCALQMEMEIDANTVENSIECLPKNKNRTTV